MDSEAHKKINKKWKEKINQEKKELQIKNDSYHEPTFQIFLSSMTMQAMISMGKLKNPLTKKTSTNFHQASFLILTLEMIKEKTKNNLSPDEKKLITDSITNLKLLYLEVAK